MHLPDSCRFLNCSVSISTYSAMMFGSNGQTTWQNMEMGGGGDTVSPPPPNSHVECGRYLENMYAKTVPSIGYFLYIDDTVSRSEGSVEKLQLFTCCQNPVSHQPELRHLYSETTNCLPGPDVVYIYVINNLAKIFFTMLFPPYFPFNISWRKGR